ncbi:hypothetical protein KIL84_020919 [Mauremys mutica]|uniref:Uncharacterized protein n=1 Tax=Mauremys mutica TaxID=74926 RepID=A0A9D3XBI4_9SAUR|nr:hypothetical protein KIL84_020919 [Mauremys mutica]
MAFANRRLLGFGPSGLRWKNQVLLQEAEAFLDKFHLMASANDTRQAQKDAADQNFDYMFKLLIIGNSSVGKTSFLFRYADDSFTSAFMNESLDTNTTLVGNSKNGALTETPPPQSNSCSC